MRCAIRILLAAFAVLAAVGLGIFFFVAPPHGRARLNPVESPPPYPASEAARALHKTLVVADLHADYAAVGPRPPRARRRAAMSTFRGWPRAMSRCRCFRWSPSRRAA